MPRTLPPRPRSGGSPRRFFGITPGSMCSSTTPGSERSRPIVNSPPRAPTRSLAWVDRAGRTEQLPARPGSYAEITLSPDGLRASLGIFVGLRSDIWIYDLGQEVLTPVTTDGLTIGGIWAPDAQHITTANQVGDSQFVFLRTLDGSGPAEPLARSTRLLWPAAWTKDGRHLVVMDGGDISIVDVAADRAIRPLIRTPAFEVGGRLSPDERWLAYFSNVTGSTELYVTRFLGGGPSWRITRGGAREAVWSRDGRELFFRSENGRQMLTAAIQPGTSSARGRRGSSSLRSVSACKRSSPRGYCWSTMSGHGLMTTP